MPRALRIPWLVDVVRTDDRTEIAHLAGDNRLDRRFEARGPLLNRLLTRRIRTVLTIDGTRLSAVAPRDDRKRAQRQADLEQRLNAVAAGGVGDQESIASLVAYVRGAADDKATIGPTVQQTIGRLFNPAYRATSETWRAAEVLDEAVRTRNPVKAFVWRITGRVDRAQRLLAQQVDGNPSAVHATGIAIHNLVRGIELMRAAWAEPGARERLSRDAAIARCLLAPPSVMRQATANGGSVAGALRPGTIVMLELGAAHTRTPGPDVAFMTTSWARCPAAAWIPALLGKVWDQARAAETGGLR
jgi:hypothetical protein